MVTLSLALMICWLDPQPDGTIKTTDCHWIYEKDQAHHLPQEHLSVACWKYKNDYVYFFNQDVGEWADKLVKKQLKKKERRHPIIVQASCGTQIES